jgi:hypothetical protein
MPEKEEEQMKGGGEPRKPPLWVKLNFKVGEVPSLVNTGAQFSCICWDVMQTLSELGVKTKKSSCRLMCHLANGLGCVIKEMVQLHFLIGKFSWNFQFKMLEEGPFPIILGLDFLSYSRMVMDMAGRKYFGFAPDRLMKFEGLRNDVANKAVGASSYFQQLAKETSSNVMLTTAFPEPNPLRDMKKGCSRMFSEKHGNGQMGCPAVSGPKGRKGAPGYAGRRG